MGFWVIIAGVGMGGGTAVVPAVDTNVTTWKPRQSSDRTLKPAGNNERVFTTRVDITRNK